MYMFFFQMIVASAACLFACLCLPSWCVAGREGGRHEQPGGRTQARRTSSDEVKGHNDQMIGTTEGKCVAM